MMMYGDCGVGVDDMDMLDGQTTFSNWDPIEEVPFVDATKAVLVVGSSNEEGELPGVADY